MQPHERNLHAKIFRFHAPFAGRRHGRRGVLDGGGYAAGGICAAAAARNAVRPRAGGRAGRRCGHGGADADRFAATFAVGRAARHIQRGAVSGVGVRRVAADAAKLGGTVLLRAAVCGLRALAAGARGVLFCRCGGAGLAAKHGGRRTATFFVPTIHTDAGNPLALFRGATRLGLAAVRGADPARANRAAAKKCRLQSAAGGDFHCARLRALPPRRMGGHDGRRHAESGATGVFRIGVSRCRQIDIVD